MANIKRHKTVPQTRDWLTLGSTISHSCLSISCLTVMANVPHVANTSPFFLPVFRLSAYFLSCCMQDTPSGFKAHSSKRTYRWARTRVTRPSSASSSLALAPTFSILLQAQSFTVQMQGTWTICLCDMAIGVTAVDVLQLERRLRSHGQYPTKLSNISASGSQGIRLFISLSAVLRSLPCRVCTGTR